MRDPRLIEFARDMRREMTEPELRLWFQLRAKRFQRIKFRRQHVIGHYIADFQSREIMLIIEVDGDTHAFQQDYDRIRELYFRGLGYQVVRFTNGDVMTNMEGVLERLSEAIEVLRGHPPHPALSPEGERVLPEFNPLSPLHGREARFAGLPASRSREGQA